ncbi:MAG TPA: thiamine phosphate synthase [Candidatus Binatia bacterium]
MPSPDFSLYLVTDRQQTSGRDLLWVVERALDGGVKAVQLREKDLEGRALYELAVRLRDLCTAHGALLFINDRIDIALAVSADGVQLGAASIPIPEARALLGPDKFIGASTHSLTEAEEAERNGADFILFGPIFFTPSKAAFGAPQGLQPLKKILEKISLPVYPIGGIKSEMVGELRATGVRGVALISAVISAQDPRSAAQEILRHFSR